MYSDDQKRCDCNLAKRLGRARSGMRVTVLRACRTAPNIALRATSLATLASQELRGRCFNRKNKRRFSLSKSRRGYYRCRYLVISRVCCSRDCTLGYPRNAPGDARVCFPRAPPGGRPQSIRPTRNALGLILVSTGDPTQPIPNQTKTTQHSTTQ